MSNRKNVLLPYTDPSLSAVNMASSHTGSAINIQYLDNVGVQMVWSGGNPLGTLVLQVSLDYNPNTGTGTWIDVQANGTILTVTPGGSTGNAYIDLNQLSAPWIRVVYTTAVGSVGSLTVTFGAKQV